MKNLKFILAGLLFLSAISSMAKDSILAGVFIMLLALIVLPPVSEHLKNNVRQWQIKCIRYATYGVVLVLIGVTSKPRTSERKSSTKTEQNLTPAKPEKIEPVVSEMDKDHSGFWKEFDPIVKERVYKLIEQKDCVGLQEEFNITAENLDKIQAAGGNGSRNLDLMDFLDDQMEELECYD